MNPYITKLLNHLKNSPHEYEYQELKKWSDKLNSKHSVTRHFARAIFLEYCHPKALPALNLTTISKQDWADLVTNLEATFSKRKRL